MAIKDSLSRALVCTTVTFMKIVQVQPIPCTDQISLGQQSIIGNSRGSTQLPQAEPTLALTNQRKATSLSISRNQTIKSDNRRDLCPSVALFMHNAGRFHFPLWLIVIAALRSTLWYFILKIVRKSENVIFYDKNCCKI